MLDIEVMDLALRPLLTKISSSPARRPCDQQKSEAHRVRSLADRLAEGESLFTVTDAAQHADFPRRRRRARRVPAGFLSVAQIVARGPINGTAVYQAIKRGDLRASRWCGKFVIAEADLHDFLTPKPFAPRSVCNSTETANA